MKDFGLREEFEAIVRGEPLTATFFDVIAKTVRPQLFRYSKAIRTDYQEVVCDFVVNYLFEEGNERIRYLLQQPDIYRNPAGMIRRMARQYLSDLMNRNNPHYANLYRRIRDILNKLEKTGEIENRLAFYRKAGSQDDTPATEYDLAKTSRDFPAWERLYQKPNAKKVCPKIGNKDLLRQIRHIFNHLPGWISRQVLYRFYIQYLDLPDCEPVELTDDCQADYEQPSDSFDEIYRSRLNPRQQDIFMRRFVNDQNEDEIAESLSLGKSSVYSEIAKIKEIFKNELEKE